MEENLKIPAHVALILDGNGRWAKKRGLPRQLGHKKGCETVEQIDPEMPDDGNVVETLPIGEDTVGQDPEPVVDPSQDAGQTAPTSGSGSGGDLAADPAETGTASGGNLVR